MNCIILFKHDCKFTVLELYKAIKIHGVKWNVSLEKLKAGVQACVHRGMVTDLGNGMYEMTEKLSHRERMELLTLYKSTRKTIQPYGCYYIRSFYH